MSGPFGSSQWMYNSGANFYNGVATQSLRFDDGSSAYLTRTPSSAANRQAFTVSCWVKRSNLGLQGIFNAKQTKDDTTALLFENSHQLLFTDRPGDNRNIDLRTNRLFRDVGAWYHIVVRVDTTQGTSSNRVRLYINGEQETSFATSSYPSQNYDVAYWNNTQDHRIGVFQDNSASYYDGYIAEFNNVGSSQAPTAFGEFKNGVWIAKAYTGSYGTNGFRLQFNQTGVGSASASTIGADTSGNTNHFTSSGIVASDCDMPDSPENNFATFNSVFKTSTSTISWGNNSITLSEGSLRADLNTGSEVQSGAFSTFLVPTSGKWYWEILCIAEASGSIAATGVIEALTGTYVRTASNTSGRTFGAGNIINVAFDADNNRIFFGIDGTFPADQTPTDASDGTSATGSDYLPYVWGNHAGSPNQFAANFGQDSTFAGETSAGGNADGNGNGDFKYSVPSGYLALCSSNLPELTLSPNADEQADDYFNTVLYTGNGSTQSITGVGFQPDWVWIKQRNAAENHFLTDVVRGAGIHLRTDQTSAENDDSATFTSFNSDGFSLTGTGPAEPQINDNTDTYVSWNWKAGGSASSNTNGSITSSVSASTDAGFSIVAYTGTQANATVGHGLSQAPTFIITKCRSSSNGWPCYHKYINVDNLSDAREYMIRLNQDQSYTDAGESSVWWNNTDPSSTVFSLGANDESNKSGDTHIAYCFHDVEGFSSFGGYKGNGSTDGTFVYTGFRPAWLMVKLTSGSGENWHMFDSERAPFNVVVPRLIADGSAAENNNDNILDFTSNGFKWRDSNAGYNGSGNNYIFMAFAENPFKYANAR